MSAAPLNTEAVRRTHQRRSRPILLNLTQTARLSLCLNSRSHGMASPCGKPLLAAERELVAWKSKRPGTGWAVFMRTC